MRALPSFYLFYKFFIDKKLGKMLFNIIFAKRGVGDTFVFLLRNIYVTDKRSYCSNNWCGCRCLF